MTDNDIHSYVIQMNTGAGPAEVVVGTPIADGVVRALMWRPYRNSDAPADPDTLFFFTGGERGFIGAVMDAGSRDLHVYVLPAHRRRGHLRAALLDVILPWLAQHEGRKTQSLTFQDPAVKRAFVRMGFRSTGPLAAARSLREFTRHPLISPAPAVDTDAELRSIRRRLYTAEREIEIAMAKARSLGLGERPATSSAFREAQCAAGNLAEAIRREVDWRRDPT